MKSIKRLMRKVPPPYVVLFVALAGVSLLVGSRLMAVEQVAVEVDMTDDYGRGRPARSNRDGSKFVTADFENPVARMASRMREASGLSLVLGLVRVNEWVSKRPAPASVDALVDLAASQQLLPPGVTIPDPPGRTSGVLVGRYATLYVRYRVEPFGVEVVSIGHTKADGAAILIRLPDDGRSRQPGAAQNKENPGVALYVAQHLDAVTIPAPFSSYASMLTAGWEPDEIHGLGLPQDRINELNEWLRAAGQR